MTQLAVSNWPGYVQAKGAVGAIFVVGGVVGTLLMPQLGFVWSVCAVGGGAVVFDVILRFFTIDESPGDARDKMMEMLKTAKGQVYVTSGCLDPTAWVDWNGGSILDVIKDRLRAGARFEIVCQNVNPRSAAAYAPLLQEYPGQLRIYRSPTNPVPHGIYIVGGRLRLEKPHNEDVIGGDRKNGFLKHPTIAAALFMATFDDYRGNAAELKLKDLEEGTANKKLSRA